MHNNKNYIYILDYTCCTINEIVMNKDDNLDVEELLKHYGFNINCCNWMITSNRIDDINRLYKNDMLNG